MTTSLQKLNAPWTPGQKAYLNNDRVKILSCEYVNLSTYRTQWLANVQYVAIDANSHTPAIDGAFPTPKVGDSLSVAAYRLRTTPMAMCKFCCKYPCECNKLSYNAKRKILGQKLARVDWWACMSDDYSVAAGGEHWQKLVGEWAAKNFKQSVLDRAWKRWAPEGVRAPKSIK